MLPRQMPGAAEKSSFGRASATMTTRAAQIAGPSAETGGRLSM
jgi:hypothetical protein